MKFATKAIHAGYQPAEEKTGAIMPPIYMSSTFALDSPGHTKNGFDYSRANNPNFTILEKTLASLEDASYATVFSSGIGALTALISTLSQGDKVVALNGIYGGTYRLFTQVMERFGIIFINPLHFTLSQLEELFIKEKPQWLLFETPTNPLMKILDIAELTKLTKNYSILSIVDNTFASPYCQSPLKLGADVVWHSSTKYIGGHSDVLGGVIVTNNEQLKHKLDFGRKTMGTNPSPFDCWLLTRGVKTLALRMQQHQKNALEVARFLEKHPKVKRVYYPGLESHPQHQLALKQMHSFNGMLSVEFNLPTEQILKMLSTFHYFTLAESLGGIESLVSHPATMTHAIIPQKMRENLGITDNLVRFSVGIEAISDLIADLEQNLNRYS